MYSAQSNAPRQGVASRSSGARAARRRDVRGEAGCRRSPRRRPGRDNGIGARWSATAYARRPPCESPSGQPFELPSPSLPRVGLPSICLTSTVEARARPNGFPRQGRDSAGKPCRYASGIATAQLLYTTQSWAGLGCVSRSSSIPVSPPGEPRALVSEILGRINGPVVSPWVSRTTPPGASTMRLDSWSRGSSPARSTDLTSPVLTLIRHPID